MKAASALAASTWPRSTERVRIVFRVPLPSSLATMSPATSEATSGSMKTDRKVSISTGVASPDCVIWATKMLSPPRSWCWWTFWKMTKNSGRITISPRPR